MATPSLRLQSEQMGRRGCPLCQHSAKAVGHYHEHHDGTLGVYVPSTSREYSDGPFRFHWHEVTVTERGLFCCTCEYGQIVQMRREADQPCGECQHMQLRRHMDRQGIDYADLIRNGSRWALQYGDDEGEL